MLALQTLAAIRTKRAANLPNSVFCLSRLLGKNPQKFGNLLPDNAGIAGQHQVGLCGQFGPPIPIAKDEIRRTKIVG